jgi:hypothetical protein
MSFKLKEKLRSFVVRLKISSFLDSIYSIMFLNMKMNNLNNLHIRWESVL